MDKFGIFKFLNSFINFYNDQNGEKTVPLNIDDLPNNPTLPLQKERETETLKAKNKQSTPLHKTPLQSQMLATMTSHDKFVNRVMQNNTKENKK